MAFQLLSSVSLPPDADTRLSPDTTPVGEIYRYTLDAPKSMPSTELRAVQDWIVERQLRTVSGVVDVIGFGGATKQYQVLIDPMKLLSYDISLRQVLDALSAGNKNAGSFGLLFARQIECGEAVKAGQCEIGENQVENLPLEGCLEFKPRGCVSKLAWPLGGCQRVMHEFTIRQVVLKMQ